MPDLNKPRPQSETDRTIVDLNQGEAERAVLGRSPLGTTVRIVVVVVLFIAIGGTIFFIAGR